jgi:hypothetical protein
MAAGRTTLDPMNLHEYRDKMFEYYGRGVLDAHEVNVGVSALMLRADDDEAVLALCDDTPDWFRENFRDWLAELDAQDYSPKDQEFFRRMAGQLRERLG